MNGDGGMSGRIFLSSLKFAGYVIFHPFKGFYELKYEKRGRLSSGLCYLILYFLSVVLKESLTGYLYGGNNGGSFSIIVCLLRAVVPILLFGVANWCLTLMLNGEGKMVEILTALFYAFIPMTVNNILFTLLSNVFSLEESMYLTLITALCIVWTAFLVMIAVMQTNQYAFMRSVFSCFLSIVGIAVLLLIILLCGDLIGQVFDFIVSLVKEISYR